MEADEEKARSAQAFYERFPGVAIINVEVTPDNIDALVRAHAARRVDLLSIDIDGNDYWVWKAVQSIRPRVVVVECHNIWTADRSVTIPYRADFDKFDVHPDYSGASLLALVKLGRAKGYRLVGCNRYGFNAFFVREGIGETTLPEVAPETCLQHPQALRGQRTRFLEVKDLEWVEV